MTDLAVLAGAVVLAFLTADAFADWLQQLVWR